jgi:hypothetical protein
MHHRRAGQTLDGRELSTLNKYLWIAATVLLVLCLRVNANRTVDGAAECILDPDKKVIWQYGCSTDRAWSVSLKFPWRRW